MGSQAFPPVPDMNWGPDVSMDLNSHVAAVKEGMRPLALDIFDAEMEQRGEQTDLLHEILENQKKAAESSKADRRLNIAVLTVASLSLVAAIFFGITSILIGLQS